MTHKIAGSGFSLSRLHHANRPPFTPIYTVRQLRDNGVLGQQTGFKDDPALKDDQKIALIRTVGWLPTKDFFNIWWQHREPVCEILNNQDGEMSQEQKAIFEEMADQVQKQMDQAGFASYPNSKHT